MMSSLEQLDTFPIAVIGYNKIILIWSTGIYAGDSYIDVS